VRMSLHTSSSRRRGPSPGRRGGAWSVRLGRAGGQLLDHFGFNVRELARSVTFYEAALAPLGIRIAERHGTSAVIFCGADEFPFFWMGTPIPSFWSEEHAVGRAPIHLSFRASRPEQVQAFYDAGLQAGGRDNGPPGDRGDDYYAAYLIDPDGNNIEAGYRASSR
jgi:catechol 2,3-dioxygenase-like lactoylglutathione lyase family enzyme